MNKQDLITLLVQQIIEDYRVNSDDIMGEFLIDYRFKKVLNGHEITREIAIEVIQEIIEWDDISWRYSVKEEQDVWRVFDIGTIELVGAIYPTRTFTVKHPEYGTNTYTVSTDRLLFDLEHYRDPENGYTHEYDHLDDEDVIEECENVDNQIYFFVDDKHFYDEAEDICKYHLDTEFELIEELI